MKPPGEDGWRTVLARSILYGLCLALLMAFYMIGLGVIERPGG